MWVRILLFASSEKPSLKLQVGDGLGRFGMDLPRLYGLLLGFIRRVDDGLGLRDGCRLQQRISDAFFRNSSREMADNGPLYCAML